jgi:hypothetical protein
MIRGTDKIVACPACKKLAKYMTLISGNTFDATLYSDGLQISPMLPRPPAVVMCEGCGHVYWLKDAEEFGELSLDGQGESSPEWRKADFVRGPDIEHYYLAIDGGLARTRKEERDVRVLAWWKSNDPFRDESDVKPIYADAASRQANMECLLSLLDEHDESDRIMKAEILRELGRFDEALKTLGPFRQGDCSFVVHQIEQFCRDRDSLVKQLDLDRAEPCARNSRPWWKFW